MSLKHIKVIGGTRVPCDYCHGYDFVNGSMTHVSTYSYPLEIDSDETLVYQDDNKIITEYSNWNPPHLPHFVVYHVKPTFKFTKQIMAIISTRQALQDF